MCSPIASKIVLQGEHQAPIFSRKSSVPKELDGEPGWGELNTRRHLGEASADQLQRAAVGHHSNVPGERRGEQQRQAVFQTLAALELGQPVPRETEGLKSLRKEGRRSLSRYIRQAIASYPGSVSMKWLMASKSFCRANTTAPNFSR